MKSTVYVRNKEDLYGLMDILVEQFPMEVEVERGIAGYEYKSGETYDPSKPKYEITTVTIKREMFNWWKMFAGVH